MLRNYQIAAKTEIRSFYQRGIKKVLLQLPTGSGKTVVFSDVMKESASRGFQSVMAVRGRALVEQASQRLFREKVPHGVRMSGHWNKNYSAPIQICSIDTLISRDDFPPAKLVVIDECDQFVSKGALKFASMYPDSFFLSVTATPYTNKSLRHLADEIVKPITMQELMEQGYLVKPIYYAPSTPSLDGIRIVNNDYQNTELGERMGSITGDLVHHWKQLVHGRPTICFAVNIKHSHSIAETFNKQGISCEHCDADTSDTEREQILLRLKEGATQIVTNVGILGRGVDMPYVSCIIMARPTRSYNLYIQQAGRGTRPSPGKDNFLILDHASNVVRHGYITTEPPADLDGCRKVSSQGPRIVVCKICFLTYAGKDCPDCGVQEVNRVNDISVEEGTLKELIMKEEDPILQFIIHAKHIARKRNYKIGWVYHQLIKRFGLEKAEEHLPHWFSANVAENSAENPFKGSPYRGVK